ncbi:MAG: SprT family zinc-dependent metalloprotease [Roseovarius sp.]|nr:SprT family zinc-dependent metalloprotease [Roseovarius sp.]
MGQYFLAGNPQIAIKLRRSSRSSRISLRISKLNGEVALIIPRHVSEDKAIEFAESQKDWLLERLANVQGEEPVRIGCEIPFKGVKCRVVSGSSRQVLVSGDVLHVPGPVLRAGPRLEVWLKAQARDGLAVAADNFAKKIDRSYSKLAILDPRSRWGSCSIEGRLMFSWRLIMAPPQVLDYVVAHEVAHLVEMNHSSAFWNVVDKLMPGFEPHRQWLRKRGDTLLQYSFSG